MKKIITILALVAFAVTPRIYAQSTAQSSIPVFEKSADEEVALNVRRGTGEVKLYLQIKDISQFDHIIVERSAESPSYFGKCRYISCTDVVIKDGYILETDRYPFSAAKDVYYRIKTVTKDGIERAYPAVLLPAVRQ